MSSNLKKIKFDDDLALEFAGDEQNEYLFRTEDGDELVIVEMSLGELIERQSPGGFIKISENSFARRALADELEREGVRTRTRSKLAKRAKWPVISSRAGVNPNQAKELRDFWKAHGVTGCTVLPNGDVEWADATARRRDCEARGLYDRNAGYGDPAPRNL